MRRAAKLQDKYNVRQALFVKGQYVRDLVKGMPVDGYFAIRSKGEPAKYKDKAGLWFTFEISDKTGTFTVKFWGGPDEETLRKIHSSFGEGDVVSIRTPRLDMNMYKGKMEIHLTEGGCEIRRMDNFERTELLPTAARDIPAMLSEFRGEIESITDDHIGRLLRSIFDDADFAKRYSETPASGGHHHCYVGGLLEHVLSMIAMARTVAKRYEPGLNADLMVAGCMLHDIGKVFQYSVDASIGYTVEGNLLGHIPMGAILVDEKISGLEGFPPELRNKILHLILSHHGSQEAGSPVTPHFPEAVALHGIDDCDAQTKYAIQAKKKCLEDDADAAIVWVKKFGHMYLK